jgi:hypothetical protein
MSQGKVPVVKCPICGFTDMCRCSKRRLQLRILNLQDRIAEWRNEVANLKGAANVVEGMGKL